MDKALILSLNGDDLTIVKNRSYLIRHLKNIIFVYKLML
jgi:hypothetical protein